MRATLAELAEFTGGKVVGDGSVTIDGAGTLADVKPGQITFIDKPEKAALLAETAAAAAIVPVGPHPADVAYLAGGKAIPVIEAADVHAAFIAVAGRFKPRRKRERVGISRGAHVSFSARLGEDVDVHAGASIGEDVEIGRGSTIYGGVQIMAGCKIGEQVTIYPNAVLYEETVVGPRCVIHGNAVLGADGFGYKTAGGRHVLQAQLGNVELGADVEVGAGTTIDRGAFGPTRIGEGTKIDNQVQVAHNCQIGKHNILCSQVGIAGSSSTGDYVVIAGQAGIRDHVHIGKGAVLGAMCGIMNDVPDGARYLGIPGTPEREQWVTFAAIAKLPEMRKQLKGLERAVNALTGGGGKEKAA